MNSKGLLTAFGRGVSIFAALLFIYAQIFAQSETATVLGTVHDKNGAVMQGANVTLKNTATGITAITQTDSSGDYQFINIKIGNYEITVEATGFSKTVASNIS